MPVTITIHGENAGHILAELRGLSEGFVVPAVSDVSSDNEGGVTADYRATPVVIGEGIPTPKPRGRKPKAETVKLPEGPALNISTGGERVDPETTAQDQAEDPEPTMGNGPSILVEPKIFTIDDVRNAATPYIKKHTMAMAQLDLQDCLEAAVGIRQISKLNTADQAQLKNAVEAFEAAGKAEARFTKKAE